VSRKKVSFTRTIIVGPCRLTVDVTGNPLAWSVVERMKVNHVLNVLDGLESDDKAAKDATPATSQP
jgi:hypothetical protein